MAHSRLSCDATPPAEPFPSTAREAEWFELSFYSLNPVFKTKAGELFQVAQGCKEKYRNVGSGKNYDAVYNHQASV